MNDKSPTAQATLERDAAPVRLDVGTIDVDVPAVAAALSQRLYAAGLPVTPERAINLAQALTLVSPGSRRQLYWTARAVFVSSRAHVPAFDHVFVSVFGSRLNVDEFPDNVDERMCIGEPARHGAPSAVESLSREEISSLR